MCGLAGFVDRSADRAMIERMTAAIRRRGPDDSGIYLEDGVGLGHRRLAIIDLSPAGHQPMAFGDLITVFNGEIYNFREVEKELEARGYSFTSSSDTEVLLKAFHCWGPRCVDRFIGMFAIAIWDKATRTMYLIRDRAGVKPLYYYNQGDRLAFGSELGSLKPYLTPAERGAIDMSAISEFLSFGYISGGLSIIESVKKVPQGHYLTFREGRLEIHRYWDVEFHEERAWLDRSEEDLLDELEDLVVSAFRYRMVADVPVGVFLSAGIDSSLVAAVLAKHHGQLSTFTIGFNEPGYDESADARKIAAYLGTDHHEAVLSAGKAGKILDHFYDIYDEPHGDNSCVPTTFVSELAKSQGMKVVLSADAGDELFGGYMRYVETLDRWKQIGKLGGIGRASGAGLARAAAAMAPGALPEQLERYADLLSAKSFIGFSQTKLQATSFERYSALFPAFTNRQTAGGEGALLNQLGEWDFKRYMVDDILVKVDRATMYHSIEGREPFLDHRLVEFAAKLPVSFKIRNGETKYLLKKLLGRYLPEALYKLPKRGFAAPLNMWVRDFYQARFVEVLERLSPALFDRREVNTLLDRYRRGKNVNYSLLWLLFSFQSWHDKWTARER